MMISQISNMRYVYPIQQKIRNSSEGKMDAGLLFAVGLFFLTVAFVIVYFSSVRISPPPFPRPDSVREMSAGAAMVFSQEEAPISGDIFLFSPPETPVREIFIGSYGSVDRELLGRIRSVVEQTFGVTTTLLNPGPDVPREEPFYDQHRGQYNSDVLFNSIKQSSAQFGEGTRFLSFADLPMASFSGWSPETPWLRASEGTNVALVSVHDLRFASNGSLDEVLPEIFFERVEKSAIRALGTTVGFAALPSAKDPSCIMYPALTPEGLDAQKITLCDPERDVLAQVFKK